MGLDVNDPGLFTTIQDPGRFGYRAWGVPVGGPFDRASADLANALVGNPPSCALLEMTLVGGTYQARHSLAVALVGAPLESTVQDREGRARSLKIPLCLTLEAGETLRIEGGPVGARLYLAVKGGWRTPVLLGSRSTESPLKAGEHLEASSSRSAVRHPSFSWPIGPGADPLRVIAGPDHPDAPGFQAGLEGSNFQVGRAINRIGLRLEGPPLVVDSSPERVSMPTAPGALQVAGGQILILGVACGTMGGYPHVAHVISADLDRLGQGRPGDTLRFEYVSLDEARRLDRLERVRLRRLLDPLAALALDRSASAPPPPGAD